MAGLYIPLEGQVTVPHEITRIYETGDLPPGLDESTNVYVQEGYYGGATKQSFMGMDGGYKKFSDYLVLDVDEEARTSTISWNIPQMEAYFGNIMNFSNISESDWYINLAVRGTPYFRGRRESNMQISITSYDSFNFGNFYSVVLPKLKFRYE